MIPESRKLTWNDDGFPLNSDEEADLKTRRYLHRSWAQRRDHKKAATEVYSRFIKEGLTKLQSYVATYNK